MTTIVQTGTAVGYFRVRSPGQAGERHVSLEVQDAAFRDDCQQHSRTPLPVFTDVASGRKDDRPQPARQYPWGWQRVVGQLLNDENIRRLKDAYSCLTENVARIEDLGDNIYLRGKPAGTCFLCPKDSMV